MVEPTVETDNTSPPDVSLEHNLFDILKIALTHFPIPRDKRIASQTTARPAKQFLHKPGIGNSDMMEGLIYYPRLLDESLLLAGELVKKITLNEANFHDVVFMTYISPELSSSFCSPELFSENDSRAYCNVGLIRPALAAMQLVKNGGIPKKFKCTDSNTDLYVTSGFKKKGSPIADNLLIKGPFKGMNDSNNNEVDTQEDEDDKYRVVNLDEEIDEYEPDENEEEADEDEEEEGEETNEEDLDDAVLLGISPEILMTMEMKTSTALTNRTFSEVVRFKELDEFANSGYVIPYVWPKKKGSIIKKPSKMVAQVYEHLYHSDTTEYAWLSSYDVNIFFFMKKNTRVMYMSDQYTTASMTPLHVFAWFCRANGVLGGDLKVPTRDDTFLNHRGRKNTNEAGLITKYMYNKLSKKLPNPPTTPNRPRVRDGATTCNPPTTPKRIRDNATEDIFSDNETTPRQRDFKGGRKRRR